MTIDEAKVFFPEPEDFADQLDEHLFGFKQFFLTKPILTATFKSRISALLKINEAATLLGISLDETGPPNVQTISFSSNVEEVVLHYFQLTSGMKLQISKSKTPESLLLAVRELLHIHRAFCALWEFECALDEDVLLSKPMDEVDFMQSIKRCSANGLMSFVELKNANLSEEPMLLKEMKRLSLQHKKEQEWMSAMQS
jgi:hypothetical protein